MKNISFINFPFFLVTEILEPVAAAMGVILTNASESGQVFSSKEELLRAVREAPKHYIGGINIFLNLFLKRKMHDFVLQSWAKIAVEMDYYTPLTPFSPTIDVVN